MSDITTLLNRWGEGDSSAFELLVPLVYSEMRGIARRMLLDERPGHTLQSTALVHEAYLKLVDQDKMKWNGRAHFFGAAANAMRQILVDHARRRLAAKRGSGAVAEELGVALSIAFEPDLDVLALDAALEELETVDPERARVVELRYFGGLTIDEAAQVLGISPSAVNRDWVIAKVWLFRKLGGTKRSP